jgi:hypothetical protein
MAPEFPEPVVPVAKVIAPLTPPVTLFAVSKAMTPDPALTLLPDSNVKEPPLPPPKESPPSRRTAPPSAAASSVDPATIDNIPPSPEEPVPTDTEMDPPRPLDAAPDLKSTEPLFPPDAAPVERNTLPETPTDIAVPLPITTEPDPELTLVPDTKPMEPPAPAPCARPPMIEIAPPLLGAPKVPPAVSDSDPPVPTDPVPTATTMLPPRPKVA